MKYVLDQRVFRQQLVELGYKNALDFSQRHGIHRNTLRQSLKGKGIFTHAFQSIADALRVDPMTLAAPATDVHSVIPLIEEMRPILGRLERERPDCAILLLGSRAKGTARPYSDWDLGVFAYPHPLTGLDYLRLKGIVEDVSEDLVREVDLVNLHQAPPWFLLTLERLPCFLTGNRDAYTYFVGVLDGLQRHEQNHTSRRAS